MNEKVPHSVIGKIISIAMDKTIVVLVVNKVAHPKYGKYITRRVKLFAHDPENSGRLSDMVMIKPCRPISKRKHWMLVKVVESKSAVSSDILSEEVVS